jgi:signal transduction histidine kinase
MTMTLAAVSITVSTAASTAASTTASTAQSSLLLHTAQAIEFVVLLSAVVVLARRLALRRTAATGWALSMFGVLTAIVALGSWNIKDDGSLLRHGFTVLLVSVLLLVPHLLVRFARALDAVSDARLRAATVLTVVEIGATLVSPRFPQPGEHRSGWFTAYVVLVIVGWTAQSVLAAVSLWVAGNGQPSVVRHRMRTLGTGAVVVSLALVSSAGSNQPGTAAQTVGTVVGVVGLCMLVLAFVVPNWLRSIWRSRDLLQLAAAERGLMAALSPDEVGRIIVPPLLHLFGARSVSLVDVPGTSPSPALAPSEQEHVRAQLAATDPALPVVVTEDGTYGCRLSQGWVVVRAGAFAPVFGPAELSLLDRVGSFVDLALQRCRLYEQEARSRRAAEAANTELQTLVYSVSHDLRNPIISVLGYLDVLAQEHAGQLQGDGQHYLDRIAVNAQYMQSLIQDLLELSRIGRSEPAPEPVPIGVLAESVAREVLSQHPGCEITVEGEFPVVWMSDLRARQLLTNLLDNAAKHGGGQARVRVECRRGADSGAELIVADDGPGIPAHHRDKANEVFERLDAARRDVPGTGMGLPICRRIAESIGGQLVLDEPPSWAATGTTVRFSVPPAVLQGWTTAPDRQHAEETAR